MATLRIEIKDSKFVSHNGVNVKSFEETYVKGNGWEITVSEEGKLECFAIQYYAGVRHLIKFKIHKGYAKLILKIGEERAKVLRSYKLKEWPSDVIIGFPGGYIDTRRPYVRRKEFQKFLDEHGISSVRNESANGIYQLVNEVENEEIIYEETIETDGNAKLILEDNANGIRRYEVTNASWVIKCVLENNNVHRILYTTDSPEEIMNLPRY